MSTRVLRLLIVDASPDDAELTLAALRKGGFLLKSQRVQDLAGLQAAIEKGGWDAAISEYTLAHFSATAVLDNLRRANVDIPLLVVTHAIPDPEIATIMRAGIRDVVLKNHMARLLPALERELAVADERALHRAAVEALKEIEDKHRAVVDGAREAICYSHDGMHIDANKAYLEMFRFSGTADIEGVPILDLIDKNDHARFKQYMRKPSDPARAPEEFSAIRQDGDHFPAEITLSPITINGEACTQILFVDVSQRKAVETKLQYLNQHDPLTGLYNRHHFGQLLHGAIEAVGNGGNAHGVIYVDFPGLREAGKKLGHAAIDRLLLNVARELREQCGPRAVLARYGDHEFTALIEATAPGRLATLHQTVEQALRALPAAGEDAGGTRECRIASLPVAADAGDPQKLMAAVFAALEPAKKPLPTASDKPAATRKPEPEAEAKPASVPAKPTLATATTPPDGEWPQRIHAAIEREAFRLIYQPIVNLHGDAGEYFEVLVRMVADDGRLIPAGQFMPPAEESGQAVAIDRWVVTHSIRALAELHRQKRDVTFFVNLSPGALREVELVVAAQQVLQETRLRGKHVIFEIDEAALTGHAEPAMAFMRAAKKIGCSFCIDNFGCALGATTRLREPPIEYLKLDGALLQDIARDPVAQASLKAVVEVAKTMEKKIIAKSVESADSLSVLWTLGIDYVQGHYIQEADSDPSYDFEGETTLSSEASPNWAVASSSKSR